MTLALPAAPAAADPAGDLGPTVAEYIAELIAANARNWSTNGSYDWWTGQLAVVESCYRYAADHPAVTTHGVPAGTSKHLALLGQADFWSALRMRRATDLAASHRNRQRRAKYAAALARYEAGQARVGGGRRAAKPAEPMFELEYTTDPKQSLISARTEQAFGMVQSFVFDRAHDAGHFPGRLNPWRTFNPRGNGGRRSEQQSPFLAPSPKPATERRYPGAGFFIDLGDALADLGAILPDGRRSGERYRYLPVIAFNTVLRPGELCRLAEEHVRTTDTPARLKVEPAPGKRLKGRKPGEFRYVDLSAFLCALLQRHTAAGLGTRDGAIFASPTGAGIDPSNWIEDFLTPALEALCGPDGPWSQYSALIGEGLYLFRHAGISSWLAYGLDSSVAAAQAGHDEATQIKYYKGMIELARGQRRIWHSLDQFVEDSLADAPPRGDGELATQTRAWLAANS